MNQKIEIYDPGRISDFSEAERLVKSAFHGAGCKMRVSSKLCDDVRSMACVSVERRSVYVANYEAYNRLVQLATNMDVYPKTNGCVHIDFTFHEMTNRIG